MKYYVHIVPNDDGIHVVHREDCRYLPLEEHRRALGEAASCGTAVRRAEADHAPAKGCRNCAPDCDHDG